MGARDATGGMNGKERLQENTNEDCKRSKNI